MSGVGCACYLLQQHLHPTPLYMTRTNSYNFAGVQLRVLVAGFGLWGVFG